MTTSGMIAPASVPQVMIAESFHHSVPSPRSGISRYETTKVMHDRDDRGQPDEERERRLEVHLVGVAVPGLGDRLVDAGTRAPLATIIMMRIAKSQTSSCDLDRRRPAPRAG